MDYTCKLEDCEQGLFIVYHGQECEVIQDLTEGPMILENQDGVCFYPTDLDVTVEIPT